MKLRDWPEFDLIHPAGANRLIAGSKTVRTIVYDRIYFLLVSELGEFLRSSE